MNKLRNHILEAKDKIGIKSNIHAMKPPKSKKRL